MQANMLPAHHLYYRHIVLVFHPVTFCLPGALMETSKHQQLFLAEDHPVAAATRRTARRPGKTQNLKSFLITDVCRMIIIITK